MSFIIDNPAEGFEPSSPPRCRCERRGGVLSVLLRGFLLRSKFNQVFDGFRNPDLPAPSNPAPNARMGRPRFLHYIMAVWNLDMADLPRLRRERIPVLGGLRGARWRCWRCTSGRNYDALSSGLVEPRRTDHRHNNRIFPALAWSLDYGESRRTQERRITRYRP